MKKFTIPTILSLTVLALAVASGPASAHCGACGSDHAEAAQAKTIYAMAGAAGFTTLAAAIDAAGLAETLSGEGPFTVFAPTDEAFAKLPEGTVEALLANPEALKRVLLHHVAAGAVTSGEVVKLEKARTLSGQDLAIDTTEGVRVGMANVTKADIMASNGVIHVIDTVLVPADEN